YSLVLVYLIKKQNKTNDEMFALLTKATDLEQQFQKNAKNTIILFIDLQGSTQYKTTHTFFESLRKIITHNTIASNILRKNCGVIIKWLGDGIMARFVEKDIIKSIKASTEIQRFFSEYNKDKSKDDKIKSKIGISIGHCLEISSMQNMTNDLMGIPVDTASRIQTLAKPGQILIDYQLKKKLNILQKDEKKRQKLKNLKISFGPAQLRNLRGIGSIKISEIRWDKFLEIRKEENDLTQEQLATLAEILSKKNTKKIALSKSHFCKPLLSDEKNRLL
ncbi:MAG: adenylate/guanylate cyclase domain-containing protein, partial [Nitrosopumilus sp.]